MGCWWNHKLARQWNNRAFQSHQQGNERVTACLQFGGVPIKQRLEHKPCFVAEGRQGSEDLSAIRTLTGPSRQYLLVARQRRRLDEPRVHGCCWAFPLLKADNCAAASAKL